MARTKLCPCCSGKLSPIGERTGGFSAGKAVAGAVIAGPVGVAAGALGKKLITLQCEKCGYTVETTEKDAVSAEQYGNVYAPIAQLEREIYYAKFHAEEEAACRVKNADKKGKLSDDEIEVMREWSLENHLRYEKIAKIRREILGHEEKEEYALKSELVQSIISFIGNEPLTYEHVMQLIPSFEEVVKSSLQYDVLMKSLGNAVKREPIYRMKTNDKGLRSEKQYTGFRLNDIQVRRAYEADMKNAPVVYENAIKMGDSAKTYADFEATSAAFAKCHDYKAAIELCEIFDYLKQEGEAGGKERNISQYFVNEVVLQLFGCDIFIPLVERVNQWRKIASEALLAEENAKRIEEEARARQATAWKNAGLCQHCGGQLSGLFGKKCKSCGNKA